MTWFSSPENKRHPKNIQNPSEKINLKKTCRNKKEMLLEKNV
jgi:hypothetical protein